MDNTRFDRLNYFGKQDVIDRMAQDGYEAKWVGLAGGVVYTATVVKLFRIAKDQLAAQIHAGEHFPDLDAQEKAQYRHAKDMMRTITEFPFDKDRLGLKMSLVAALPVLGSLIVYAGGCAMSRQAERLQRRLGL